MSESRNLGRRKNIPFAILAALLGIAWLSTLLFLTVQFANPVTINRAQILESNTVLQGKFAAKDNAFKVTRAWGIAVGAPSIQFDNVSEVAVEHPQEYLVPTLFQGQGFVITPSHIREIPLIYPATDDAIKQLEAILKQGDQQPIPRALPD